MNDKLALFQTLATMPNAISRENKARAALAKHVGERMEALAEAEGIPDYAEGRRQYLEVLKRRALHLKKKAVDFFGAHQTSQALDVLGPEGEPLRDFYHDVYYALLFAARYALVSHNRYDCSQHIELPKVLEEQLIVPEIEKEAAAKTKGALEEFFETRNAADYSANVANLKSVASLAQLRQAVDRLEEVFRLWSLT